MGPSGTDPGPAKRCQSKGTQTAFLSLRGAAPARPSHCSLRNFGMIAHILRRVASLLVWLIAILLICVTLLPLWNTNEWWVRALGFPRVQIFAAACAVLIGALFLKRPSRLVIALAMIGVCSYQAWRVYPYTPLAAPEMALAAPAPDSIRVITANVQMGNTRYQDVIDTIEHYDPDILLLLETDEAWLAELEPMLSRYSTVVRQPQDNYYGLVFATRLSVDEARVIQLTNDRTPSLFARLKTPDGQPFHFLGLHPRPPVPGEDTDDRDRQIYAAAKFAAMDDMPVVAMGDFNDVAWSETSQTFRRVGGYLDPRIGRGFFASFDANSWFLRFPLNQFYATSDVAVVSIERLEHVGSDHFPMAATFRVDPDLAATLNVAPQPLTEEDRDLIDDLDLENAETLESDK
ncbi:endonuclease/exonuclease/phosphatase family protein [Paracoccus haeundaensis]|uniref:Endonuclease/exonuclease/phosphatase family protein n=2 Tax=Paracoccus haeundaensis TaxID=225362 RepID=A0A5C4R2D8_9RHOB|nr:endonuclease/exonuclease/phosphatase family protein [Paracoccus haeundaensis]